MKLHSIHAGNFKLDGGAMFGVVPKSIWNRLNPADENNMCSWAMRCLLIDTGDRKILIDSGMGNKQNEKFFSHYYLHGNQNLGDSLKEVGYSHDDITDHLLSHLHFDHCGGSISKDEQDNLVPTFKNAIYHVGEEQWKSAVQPNAREKASFLKENILPMEESGRLNKIQSSEYNKEWLPGIEFDVVFGHTTGMLIPKIKVEGKTLVFCADLLPSVSHFKTPYVMGYDIRPLETMKETQKLLKEAYENDYILFLEHDPEVECATVTKSEKGYFEVKETFTLSQALNI